MANLNEAYNTLVEQQAEEIKKLKEEIKKVVSKIHEMNDTKNSPTKDFHNNLSNVVWYYFQAKNDEIAKLKEENEKLKAEVSYLTDWNVEKLNENYVPLEDYEKLKEENDVYYCKVEMMESKVSSFDEMKTEIKKVREENEKLKSYPKLVHNISQNLHSTRCEDCLTMEWIDEEIRKGQDRPPPEHKSTHPEYHDLMPFLYTIKELKEEIKNLNCKLRMVGVKGSDEEDSE